MVAMVLVNTVTINNPNSAPTGALMIKAGETISDTGVQAAVATAGGILAQATDPNIIAAVAIVNKMRAARGQSEDAINTIMAAAYIKAASQGELITYNFTAASTASEAEIAVGQLSGSGTITGAFYVPNATATPTAGSNNDVFVLTIYNAAGVAIGQLATATLANATPMTQWVRFPFGTLANVAFQDGYTVTYKSTVTGSLTGQGRPIGQLVIVGTR